MKNQQNNPFPVASKSKTNTRNTLIQGGERTL